MLIGEASHGTQDFYAERAEITRRLIEERGFQAVAVEADWPDAYRINCYVRGASEDRSGNAALGDFERLHVTPVPIRMRSVACAIPPITLHTNGLWPWRSIRGWKWSEMKANGKPASSASRAWRTSSRGPCSSHARV